MRTVLFISSIGGLGNIALFLRPRLTAGLAVELAVGLATGLAAGLAVELAVGLATGLAAGLATGLATGLAAGLAVELGLATGLAVELAVELGGLVTKLPGPTRPPFVRQPPFYASCGCGITASAVVDVSFRRSHVVYKCMCKFYCNSLKFTFLYRKGKCKKAAQTSTNLPRSC
ncbi:MAG: hypothetical protein E6Q06_01935 [Candidatus Moraniibacteriota bacterium]|nr:MAG: hypothetical protein E6Q06_01935 [Candidatus Moranbacteria bacterium]